MHVTIINTRINPSPTLLKLSSNQKLKHANNVKTG